MGSSPSGRYSAGGVSQTKAARLAAAARVTVARRRRRPAVSHSMPARTAPRRPRSFAAWPSASERKCMRALAVGSTVMATTMDARIDAETAIAISE